MEAERYILEELEKWRKNDDEKVRSGEGEKEGGKYFKAITKERILDCTKDDVLMN